MVWVGVALMGLILIGAVEAYKADKVKKLNLCVIAMVGLLVLYIVLAVVFKWPFF